MLARKRERGAVDNSTSYHPSPLFDRVYEWVSRLRPFTRYFDRHRHAIAQMSQGRVLELGAGGGQSFSFYDPSRVSEVVATEPDSIMIGYARRHIPDGRVPIHVTQATAEHLPFATGAFDTVQATLVLCSVANLTRSLGEIARVLKPEGQLLLFEHVRNPHRWVAAMQTAFTPVQRRIAGNCHLNRDIRSALLQAGFSIELEKRYGGGLFPMRLYAARCPAVRV